MATTTKNLGIVSPVPADDWNASTTYQKLNIVSHNNGSYIAKQGSTGIEPGVTTNWQTYWMLLVSATGGGGSDVEVVQTTGQSTTAVMSQNAVTEALNNKVDKITGKGLSTNDFTNDEKNKLAGIETGAEVNEIDTITAGSNVTVSKSGKTVTISATGGGGSDVEVVQTTGQSTTAVMSQKAVTDELNGKASTSYVQGYVQGNPTENGTVDLTKLKVGNTVYNVPQGGGGGSGGGTQLYKHTIFFNRTSRDRDELYIITNVGVPLNYFSDVEVWDFYVIVPESYIINNSGNQVAVVNCYISMERLSGVGYNIDTGAVEAIRDHDLVEGDITDTVTPLQGVTQ